MEQVKNANNFYCKPCRFMCCKLSDWSRHITTRKHLEPIKTPERNKDFICEHCSISCCKLSNWNRHILSKKHIQRAEKTPTHNSVVSDEIKCESQYVNIIDRLLNENVELRNLIVEQTNTNSKTIETIMIQNNEIISKNTENMNKALELCKSTNTTINQTTNNNRFNINVFLNETCKDAINFSDFIKNIQVSYEDLENNAQLGFVNGISKIFLDNLKQLDVYDRPIHCTDVKRETIYIKDENVWTKQPDDDKLQRAIQTVSYRSMGKLAEWKQENPDYKDCNSEFSQKCLDIHRNTLAGNDRQVYYPKVIHALARETIIEK